MNTNDFRIGNAVKCKTSNDAGIYAISQIDGINDRVRFASVHRTEIVPIEKVKPILLTNEILTKWCGFKDYAGLFSHNKLGSIMFIPVYGHGYFLVRSNGGDKLTSVKYLHQLQNLFYSLTGEELQLNVDFN